MWVEQFILWHFWSYLLVVNAATYFIYWLDKKLAVRQAWRISELGLLAVTLAGGSPAAFVAQRKFRHKIKKVSFQIKFWVVVALQLFWLSRHYSLIIP